AGGATAWRELPIPGRELEGVHQAMEFLTDMIRFGSLYLRDGVSLAGQQVVPAAWIADTFDGGPDSRQAFAASPDDNAQVDVVVEFIPLLVDHVRAG
ncbi:hypothetical protein ACNJQJ_21040, partial [Mycobacterium tuberculosis]